LESSRRAAWSCSRMTRHLISWGSTRWRECRFWWTLRRRSTFLSMLSSRSSSSPSTTMSQRSTRPLAAPSRMRLAADRRGRARGEFVVTIDDDLQNAPEDILRLYRRMCAEETLDVIFGTPSNKKQHNPIRRTASYLLAYIDRVSSGSQYQGFTSSFRIMRRST